MKISTQGLNFIKSFEGCDLTAVKYPGEKYYTIGYGFYDKSVKANQTITEQEASDLLIKDLERYYPTGTLSQQEFDALTSYHYNCGTGASRIWKLRNNKVHNGTGKTLPGLVRRRCAEMILSFTGQYITTSTPIKSYLNKNEVEQTSIKTYSAFSAMLIQWLLGLDSKDGIFGPLTKQAVQEFQKSKGLKPDGVVGPITWAELKKIKM